MDKNKKRNNQRRNNRRDQREYDSKLLDLSRVAHTREGGRRLSFRAVMVLGDHKGKIGVGVASGSDVAKGIGKASRKAEKSMIEVPIVNGTIPHQVEAKYSAARVLLKPQRKKRGLVAGGTVRIMCNLAGIEDISSKVLGGTSNKLNNARAVIKAFKKLRKPQSQVKNKKEK
jgi:small subunit ribosomal protein S5